MRKIIINIASLIHNQKNILKELKMNPPPVNFMKKWINKLNEEEEKQSREDNQFLNELLIGNY